MKSLTPDKVAEIMSLLPDDLDEHEIGALTLTLHSAYFDEPADIFAALIQTIFVFGCSQGLSRETVAEGLKISADSYSENQPRIQ